MTEAADARGPVWDKFGWLKDPEWEGAGKIVWRDGSTLLAETADNNIALLAKFFERHPYFERAEVVEPYFLKQALRIWLTHREPPPEDAPWSHRELPAAPPLPADWNDLPLPEAIKDRPHDLWLGGYLDPGYDLFAVHPDVEALWYVWTDGDGPHPDAWNAKIWLRQA